MSTLLDGFFWLNLIYFVFCVFIAYFIPADVILKRVNLSFVQRLVLGTVLGMILWGWQGFVFGYLNLRWLSYIYLLFFCAIWIKDISRIFIQTLKKQEININLIFVILLLGTFFQVSMVWFSGLDFGDGLYMYGNPSDSLWHLSLSNQLIKSIPPIQPGMTGVVVNNYHYWSNIVIAELIRVFKLPFISTQFQYSTIYISLFLGLSAIVFGQLIKIGDNFIKWLLFFLYFGGDLIYLLLILLGEGLVFPMGSLEDGTKFLFNPPRAISIVLFFSGLSFLHIWLKERSRVLGIMCFILLGSIIGFKVYVGIFVLLGLFFLSVYYLLKKQFKIILYLLLAFAISAVIYIPVNSNAGGLYFTGFWMFQNFIVQPGLNLERLELARRIFLESNKWFKALFFDLTYILLFFISVFGTKLIGLIQSKNSILLLPAYLNIILISGLIGSFILGSFFQQVSGGSNTFNFLVNFYIIFSIYSALSCSYWLKKISYLKVRYILTFVIILLTLPRPIHEWKFNMENIFAKKGYFINNNDLNTLKFLRSSTAEDSIVLVDYDTFSNNGSSPYVSYFSNRPVFLTGDGILESHNIDISKRLKVRKAIYSSNDGLKVASLIRDNSINYIVLKSFKIVPATNSAEFLSEVYNNGSTKVLRFSLRKAEEYIKSEKLKL